MLRAKEVAGSGGKLYEVLDLVEKPKLADAPSNLAVIGRYILTPTVFETLSDIRPGAGGELQLTDGLRGLLQREKLYAYVYEGRRHDTGDKLGFLKATVEFALKSEDLGGEFRQFCEDRCSTVSKATTEGIRAHRNGISTFFASWDLNWDRIRGGAGVSLGINRRYYVVVDRTVFHEVVYASGTADGNGVNLLAVTARGILLCGILLLAAIQAVTHSLAFGVDRGSTRIPRKSHLVVSSSRQRLQRRKACRRAGGKFRLGRGWKCSVSCRSLCRRQVRA